MNNETLVAGERLGPYAIVGRIGQGGMGEVYLAEDTALHRRVALKVLPLRYSADKNRRERMTREGRALASLNYRNIATLHGVEYVGAAPVLVMEFVEGPTLAERLHGDLPLTLDEVLPREVA